MFRFQELAALVRMVSSEPSLPALQFALSSPKLQSEKPDHAEILHPA